MVSKKSVVEQLKKIGFNHEAWGRAEAHELHNILIPEEEIYECVNGIYEGGFALLVSTNLRVLLVDKKPLNYLTVEDLRFDMINEIDYSHRLLGAQIDISTGSRDLRFRSYNQQRLRKLINHVQHCMAEAKAKQNEHQEDQKQHLQDINTQLQTYLFAQHQQQQQLHQQLQNTQMGTVPNVPDVQPIRPSPELADYLFAQSLLAQHQAQQGQPAAQPAVAKAVTPADLPGGAAGQADDLYDEGIREIFGKRPPVAAPAQTIANPPSAATSPIPPIAHSLTARSPLDINALRIAYSKLPMALRNRKFGRPSFHAHSQAPKPAAQPKPQNLPALANLIR